MEFRDVKLQKLLDKLQAECYRRVDEKFPQYKKRLRARQIEFGKIKKAVTAEFLSAPQIIIV